MPPIAVCQSIHQVTDSAPSGPRYLHHSVYGAGPVARELAPVGGLVDDQDVGSDRVHIRYLGNGWYGFRPYGGSLLERPKSNQKAFAPTLGTSLTLGVPVIRQVFGGPPPRAIHGAGRLNRHPCRFTPQIPVEFRPACLTGRLRSKARSRSRSRTARFASWLAGLLQRCVDTYGYRRQASHIWIGFQPRFSSDSISSNPGRANTSG